MNSYALHIPCAVYLWLLVSPWTEEVLRKRAFKGCHRHCVMKEIKSFIFCLPMLVCTSYATTSVIVNNFQGKEKCRAIWYIALHSSPRKSTLIHVCTKYWRPIDRNPWIFFFLFSSKQDDKTVMSTKLPRGSDTTRCFPGTSSFLPLPIHELLWPLLSNYYYPT